MLCLLAAMAGGRAEAKAADFLPAAEKTSGLYAVAATRAEGVTGLDISVTSGANIQMVTIVAAEAGNYRVVLTDAEGQILRTRTVSGEAMWDFQPLPTGTYRLAILNASGEAVMHQTLQKR